MAVDWVRADLLHPRPEGSIMTHTPLVRSTGRALAYGAGIAAGAYATYAATTWLSYGHAWKATGVDADPLLDRFIPAYEVAERHTVHVNAPPDITFAASCDVDLHRSRIIQAIFKGRELALGAIPEETTRPRGLVALTKALGWGVLAEVPGRELVMGAVTKPWTANPLFRALPPDAFAAFDEPDYVKIVWTLRADPLGPDASMARTETRVIATDPAARRKFRRYWSIFSPGIVLIRRVALRLTKLDAERRARERDRTADRMAPVSAGDLDPEC
jgi:hypothetical protein